MFITIEFNLVTSLFNAIVYAHYIVYYNAVPHFVDPPIHTGLRLLCWLYPLLQRDKNYNSTFSRVLCHSNVNKCCFCAHLMFFRHETALWALSLITTMWVHTDTRILLTVLVMHISCLFLFYWLKYTQLWQEGCVHFFFFFCIVILCCIFCVWFCAMQNCPPQNVFCFRFYKACSVFHTECKEPFLSNSQLYHPPVTVRPMSSNILYCSKLSEYCENGHDYNPPSQG